MKKLIIAAAALLIAVGAQAQGYFQFNTRNTTLGETVTFTDAAGNKLSGPDFFVQVFAGSSANNLQPIAVVAGNEPLALNRTGTGAGLANPFSRNYTTALPAGTAFIGYQAYQGTAAGISSATLKSDLISTKFGAAPGTALTVQLVEAPNLPNELTLGTGTVALVPEPTTLALGLVGLGTLLAFRRRQ